MHSVESVKEVLRRSGMTKSALSARSGVSRALLDDYLKGRRQPSVAQLARLGEAAGLRLHIAWRQLDVKPTPAWAQPNPAMNPEPLTVAQRAKVLELVVGVALALQRRPRGPLEAPPFREFGRSA